MRILHVCCPSKSANRAGFTLLEVSLAIVLVGILSFSIWSLAQVTGNKRVQAWRSTDASNALLNVDYALRTHLDNAGRGMISTFNYGPMNVRLGEIGAVPYDTVIVLRADTANIRNASRPCQSGGASCVILIGDHRNSFDQGDLMVTGSPATGARVLQAIGSPNTFSALCGVDCLDDVFCHYTSDSEQGLPPSGVISYVSGKEDEGGVFEPGAYCVLPFNSDGSSCTESWDNRTFERQHSTCAPASASTTFTEIPVVDRTTEFGYPIGPSSILVSATATPKIRTQKVRPVRFFVRNANTNVSELVQQTGIDENGNWLRTTPIAGPITRFQVETLHASDSEWVRGVGVTESALAHASSNRVRTLTADATAPQGYSYARAYSTIAASRITYDLLRIANDGEPQSITRSVLLNATPALGGGSDGG